MNDYNRGALPDPCLRLDYGFGDEWKSVELGDGTGYVRLSDYEKLKVENDKLREDIAKARDPQRIGGQADHESFIYAIEQLREFRWQHATNDEDAIPYINKVAEAHERENAKLRELARDLRFCARQSICLKCKHGRICDLRIDERCAELGIEVGE